MGIYRRKSNAIWRSKPTTKQAVCYEVEDRFIRLVSPYGDELEHYQREITGVVDTRRTPLYDMRRVLEDTIGYNSPAIKSSRIRMKIADSVLASLQVK